ncbi:RtcB family protein [bacterium]|nr:RtcB family protein [bacterium]
MKLERIDKFRWRVPKNAMKGMRVDGKIYSSSKLIKGIEGDASVNQVANVATLPGIVGESLAMPDIHWGYGFPIGGVAAFDLNEGVISPGGVGYDINCGVNLTRSKLFADDIRDRLPFLADVLLSQIPCGVGVGGDIVLNAKEMRKVSELGARWVAKRGMASLTDIEHMEEGGCLSSADPEAVSDRACERGRDQLGTLGSGNHFMEVQEVQEIYDPKAAQAMGLEVGQVVFMVHSGSRGFGYQICQEHLKKMGNASNKYNIPLVDRQLACAPIQSPEGKEYAGAMAAGANFAWANRLILVHRIRRIFEHVFGMGAEKLGLGLVFDVSHNIAKFETHLVNGKKQKVCVHRKGATRAFGPGDDRVSPAYRGVGQPVLIPGDMRTGSFVLVGTGQAMEETFGSTCHGAGRVLSRTAALKATRGRDLTGSLEKDGVYVRARKLKTLGEEAPEAYKNVDSVVDVAEGAGIARKVARLKPLVVIKG